MIIRRVEICVLFLFLFLFCGFLGLKPYRRLSRDRLLEVARQVLLEVEVGELLGRIRHRLLVVLEKLLQLVVGKNETTVLLGLEVV